MGFRHLLHGVLVAAVMAASGQSGWAQAPAHTPPPGMTCPGDRLVFVITGVAINNAPVPVAGIQIQGRVIGAEDRRQIVYAGAAPQDVIDLGIREIELLQTLKPSGDWVLRPGEQDRFLVAFVEPALPLSEFGAEVIAVRGVNGRVEGPLAKR